MKHPHEADRYDIWESVMGSIATDQVGALCFSHIVLDNYTEAAELRPMCL